MAIELCRATDDERRRPLPGDALVPDPMGVITHAITIDAPPEDVWPWLVQLGAGRAGWYAWDRIDNGGVASAREIVPALQQVAVGDIMPSLPGARDSFVVGEVIPGRALVLTVPLEPAALAARTGPDASSPTFRVTWTLVVDPLGPGRSRLISRGRVSREWLAGRTGDDVRRGSFLIERVYGLLARLPYRLLLPVAGGGHYLMESRMLRGVQRRAEQAGQTVVASRPMPRRVPAWKRLTTAHVEGEVVIARPVDEVFDVVADERNEPRYNPDMLRSEQVSDGPIGPGTRFEAEMRVRGGTTAMATEYTEFDRPRRIGSTSRLSTMEIHGTLSFEPVPAGARLRWAWDVEPRGLLKLATPLVARMGERLEWRIWTGLKHELEARPAPTRQPVARA